MKKSFLTLAIGLLTLSAIGQNSKLPSIDMKEFQDGVNHWYGIKDKTNLVDPVPNQPVYSLNQIVEIADNVLLFQRNNGGWLKNYDMKAVLTPEQKQKVIETKADTHTTFDNSTTYTHIAYLAKVYSITKEKRFKKGVEKGIRFCMNAQYNNGGWPQYFPLEKGYSRHITFNDGAYMGVLKMMRDIADNKPEYAFLSKKIKLKAEKSYQQGLNCLLKCQITDNGELTVWCQQHDEVTLQPTWARAFEPPSICNGESAEIVLYLMSIENPDEQIVRAVKAAVKWYEESKIYNTRLQKVDIQPEETKLRTVKYDLVAVTDSSASPIWTRYYELGSHRPLFCDRNSKFLYSLAEVSLERRSGYAWYVNSPQRVLDKYPQWAKKWLK